MNLKILAALPALFASAALAGPYDQPWSIVESGDRAETKKDATVAITKVDGKSTRSTRKSDPIEPGKHVITVSYETANSISTDRYREMTMDLEGCTRYRVVARYVTRMDPKWEPHVYPEPIPECVKQFKKKEDPKK
ncbi:hypothetical protein [Usitatibacter palustris]|uniref:Uncharacterized protein n=1 Tax=Usitatibacter palustris TaxID=2732487 RepID=A0A6M4HC47_9PROT|nr:hypothetical protein [Usitatibacter palustris]QJR16173.1 hypothetical protein DSM104440_03002 [Usitatibacter palustris]